MRAFETVCKVGCKCVGIYAGEDLDVEYFKPAELFYLEGERIVRVGSF